MRLNSQVIVTQKPKEILSKLEELRSSENFIIIDTNEKEFLLEHASEAISKAFIASEEVTFIILIAPKFSIISQNKLLKILEEPPLNKEFILITKYKSSILSTIKSRLPITIIEDNINKESIDLDIDNLNLEKVYEFIQKHNHISSTDSKDIVEKIAVDVIKSKKYKLDNSLLKTFEDSIKALDIGSPSTFILNGLLLKLLSRKY